MTTARYARFDGFVVGTCTLLMVACAGSELAVQQPNEPRTEAEAAKAPAAAPSASAAASDKPPMDTAPAAPTTTATAADAAPDRSWESLVQRSDTTCKPEMDACEKDEPGTGGRCYEFCLNGKFPCRSECEDECRDQSLTVECMDAHDKGQAPPHCHNDSSSPGCKTCLEHCDWSPK